VLPESETHQLAEWNATAITYPPNRCVHDLFEAQAAKWPDAVAVVDDESQLSYKELNAQANRLARHLRRLGVRPDTRVALCVERSVEMMVGLLAVFKAGGAYVPLDPSYPAERLSYMLSDSAPVVLLTHPQVPAELRSLLSERDKTPAIDLIVDAHLWADEQSTNLDRSGLTSRHLAYVLYTSGSTGQPKGGMNEHRAVVNLLSWMQSLYSLGPDDAVLQKIPFSFDASVRELFSTLTTGGKLVMARAGGHRDPGYLVDRIQQERVTTLFFVPSMLTTFLDHEGAAACSSIKRVMSGGEALPGSLARRCRERLPYAQLYQVYGPTEAAVNVTAWPCMSEVIPDSVPIGRPMKNTRIYILDSQSEALPIGVPGELCIGGAQVARGYLDRPSLTAERFVPDPCASEAGGRMYRTGDIVRHLPDGNIEFLGRNDFQVKIRGVRIELGEIEMRLRQFPGLRDAIVLARQEREDTRLIAYYTIEPQASARDVNAATLRSYLLSELPDHMVPVAYMLLDALPLMPNAKVDRRALPAPEYSAYALQTYEAPVGEIEVALAGIWADVLRLERVSRHDDFFALGGHSLVAITVLERMRRAGLETDVRTLFASPTVAGLAAVTKAYEQFEL
jgi:arthrofactin-type cyclic lipopeptide synthetase C